MECRRHSVSVSSFGPTTRTSVLVGGTRHDSTPSPVEAMYKDQVARLSIENRRLQVGTPLTLLARPGAVVRCSC
jgi:hypothetical protein